MKLKVEKITTMINRDQTSGTGNADQVISSTRVTTKQTQSKTGTQFWLGNLRERVIPGRKVLEIISL